MQTQGMRAVKVKKDALLQIVKENRVKHYDLFDEAQSAYRTEVIKRLDIMLADAKAGKRIEMNIGLIAPVDQTPEYDRVIRMLEMSVDDEVTLTQDEFECYVMDQWAWSQQALMANTAYTRKEI